MRLVVDSDGGIDDAAALTWLAHRPEVELAAVTAVGGNVGVRAAARNLCAILQQAGRPDVPVHVGLEPTDPAPEVLAPVTIHGHDGLGDCGVPDPDEGQLSPVPARAALAAELARGTRLLTLGPLTNLAGVLRAEPGLAAGAPGPVVMGGSARAGGNAQPVAEANVAHDPLAAATVLGAAWRTPPVLVGLDATHRATLGAEEFELLGRRATPAARFLAGPLAFYRRESGTFCPPGQTPCHDLLAAMVVVHPELVDAHVLPVAVDVGGSAAWGQTVVDLRPLLAARSRGQAPAGPVVGGNAAGTGAPVAVALDADAPGFRKLFREFVGGD